jgi:hypothetical protein
VFAASPSGQFELYHANFSGTHHRAVLERKYSRKGEKHPLILQRDTLSLQSITSRQSLRVPRFRHRTTLRVADHRGGSYPYVQYNVAYPAPHSTAASQPSPPILPKRRSRRNSQPLLTI